MDNNEIDLNTSLVPQDTEECLDSHVEDVAPHEHVETAVEILRRERKERKERLQREQVYDRPMHVSPQREQVYDRPMHASRKREQVYDRPMHVSQQREKVYDRPMHVSQQRENVYDRPMHVSQQREQVYDRPIHVSQQREQVYDRPMHVSQQFCQDRGPLTKKVKYDRSRLPQGWLDCPEMGEEIFHMIPSKVPLDESYNIWIPSGRRYSFQHVLRKLNMRRKKIGMVVDLTNTSRYYSTNDFRREGIKYLKIRCQGRDSVPDNESVNTFVYEVTQFLNHQNAHKDMKKCVFIHCTHGHNRTGYMIVHYLMRTFMTSVSEAVETFAAARPPGIYKQDYVEALYNFYHEPKPEGMICPSTPEWKRSSENINGEAVIEDDDGNPLLPTHDDNENVVYMTNDDVLGDNIPYHEEAFLREVCYRMIGVKGHPSKFPGSHPVSLSRDNSVLLRQKYYYATWKADGTRYMLMITRSGCYLIDRSFKFRRVQMRFPGKTRDGHHHFTLLDGEMVIDNVNSPQQKRRYLIYDLIAVNDESLVKRPFHERWKRIEKEVVEPRTNERKFIESSQKFYYRYDWEPFSVRRKDFWLLSTVHKLLNEFIPHRLSHKADGLIFQSWDDHYVSLADECLLKWKPLEMNSVDFLFEVDSDGNELLSLIDRGRMRVMEGMKVKFEDGTDPSVYSGKIIECAYRADENVWPFLKVRVDKSTPNAFRTYVKVMESIKDNITAEYLMNEINETVNLPLYKDRIQQDIKATSRR